MQVILLPQNEKNYIWNYCSVIEYKDIFPLSNSSNNIRNIFDDDYSEEDFFKTNATDISNLNSSEMMSSLTFYYWKNREEYINTGYAVTGWMLIVITQICEYALVNAK